MASYITEVFKKIECHNPISGHRWTEWGDFIGYEVAGGKWCRTRHRTFESAEKEKALRDRIDVLMQEVANV